MIFVDTGAWYASMVPHDVNHVVAADWFNGNKETLVTSDYVFSETVTLLLSRKQRPRAEVFGAALLSGKLAVLEVVSRAEIDKAWQTLMRYSDKDWSFTDCTSKVLIERLGISVACSFDHHFRQFGTVTVVP